MNNLFFNRRGREIFADDVVPAVEKGYFALFIRGGKVLLRYPPRVDVPEFIGGICPREEDVRACLFRLLYEQSGYEQIPAVEEKCFEQEINYFDETLRAANPFIVYHQVFKVFDAGEADGKKDDGWWRTPEGGRAGWIDLYRLFEGEIRINYTHWLALQALFPED